MSACFSKTLQEAAWLFLRALTTIKDTGGRAFHVTREGVHHALLLHVLLGWRTPESLERTGWMHRCLYTVLHQVAIVSGVGLPCFGLFLVFGAALGAGVPCGAWSAQATVLDCDVDCNSASQLRMAGPA